MSWTQPAKLFLLLACLSIAFFMALWLFLFQKSWNETQIVFLSVGEGDAILITHGSYQVLIDSGREGKRLLSHLGAFIPFYDHEIEAVIETHPDADHIGGFSTLLKQYQVDHFFTTGAKSDTETVKLLDETLAASPKTKVLPAFAGTAIDLGDGGKLEMLYPKTPLPERVDETNPGSVVARLTYGETSFLFTGDLPEEETYLPSLEPVTVLKVAHHGSRYSTSAAWLEEIRPHDAVISVGPNTYGHPSPDVMERLSQKGIQIYRTDTEADVIYRCRAEWNGCRHQN